MFAGVMFVEPDTYASVTTAFLSVAPLRDGFQNGRQLGENGFSHAHDKLGPTLL